MAKSFGTTRASSSSNPRGIGRSNRERLSLSTMTNTQVSEYIASQIDNKLAEKILRESGVKSIQAVIEVYGRGDTVTINFTNEHGIRRTKDFTKNGKATSVGTNASSPSRIIRKIYKETGLK